MADQPAQVSREARSIHAGLKTLLARDVWGNYREADFQRKNLRRRYLHLLLLHPAAPEAREAGTHLWMQTSYAFIALYKQRLARNNANANSNRHGNNDTNANGRGGHGHNNNNTVETRKLLQRFRQFLADEERFWRALVLRVQRERPYAEALVELPFASASTFGTSFEQLPGVTSTAMLGGQDVQMTGPGKPTWLAALLPPDLVCVAGEEERDGPEDRMNHFGFPPERGEGVNGSLRGEGDGGHEAGGDRRDGEGAGGGLDPAQARSVLSKALVCLGDIARYREQYRGPTPVPPMPKFDPKHNANPNELKKKLTAPRANYARPRALYLAAHALAPYEGNAAHQVAILAGYESDTLSSLAWYLRALCAPAAFDTAGENLAAVLARVVAGARARGDVNASVDGPTARVTGQSEDRERGGGIREGDDGDQEQEREGGHEQEEEEDTAAPPRVRIERWKHDVVLLHGLWREGRCVVSLFAIPLCFVSFCSSFCFLSTPIFLTRCVAVFFLLPPDFRFRLSLRGRLGAAFYYLRNTGRGIGPPSYLGDSV
ncbi:hypothetical protein C8R43DRAFT_207304 [Mycena crocata]|nr:hypothetical protein C8R43DRAFT_207304 [Mycena crocata]